MLPYVSDWYCCYFVITATTISDWYYIKTVINDFPLKTVIVIVVINVHQCLSVKIYKISVLIYVISVFEIVCHFTLELVSCSNTKINILKH